MLAQSLHNHEELKSVEPSLCGSSTIHTMATLRTRAVPAFSYGICRQCSRASARRSLVQSVRRPLSLKHNALRPAIVPSRWHSTPASNSKVYEFDQIKQISERPSPDRILIGMALYLLRTSPPLTTLRCSRTFRGQRRLHTQRDEHSHQVTT